MVVIKRLLVLGMVLAVFWGGVGGRNILRSGLSDFNAQLDQVYLLSLLTANGPTTAWFLFEAPTCGNLYQITPEIELNGGNPCEGGMLETDGCGEPLVGGTNLTTIVSLEEPYLVYLFRSEDVRSECPFGFIDEIIIEEYNIPQNITIQVNLTQNMNNAPIAFGQSIETEDNSTSFDLLGLPSPSNANPTIITRPPPLGSLTDLSGSPLPDNVPIFSTIRYHPPAGEYSSGGEPLEEFSFVILGESGWRSNEAVVSLFVRYPSSSPPLVDTESLTFLSNYDNTFHPTSKTTDNPRPITFFLTSFPTLTTSPSPPTGAGPMVYQSTAGKRVGPVISTLPAKINDELIFYIPSGWVGEGEFRYKAVDAAGMESDDGVVSFRAEGGGFPIVTRCLANVAVMSSTVVNFRTLSCVQQETGSVPVDQLNFYIITPPSNGELYLWENNQQGRRIWEFERNIKIESGAVLFVNVLQEISPQYTEIRYKASVTDQLGTPLSESLVINIVPNTPPFIEMNVRVRTDEDIPAVVPLGGRDFEEALLIATINTLPTRGKIYQYDDTKSDNIGDEIKANENTIFTPTRVLDPQNRVVFLNILNENGDNYASFTYFVSDGVANSNWGNVIVDVTPVPDDPVSSSSYYTVEEVTQTLIQLDGFDPESADNARLIFELLSVPNVPGREYLSGQLFQTDGLEGYDPNLPILNASLEHPVQVLDPLGRLIYVSADVPVEFVNNGSRFAVTLDFDFRAVVPPQTSNGVTVDRQESNISNVTIEVFGVNNPPISKSQSVTTNEDTPVVIYLEGFDPDAEDTDNLEVFISQVPRNGMLSQWADLEETSQFDIIRANGNEVIDSLFRVIYSPNRNQVGDPLDSFTFVYFDGKESSFSSEVTITVLCVNDSPELGNLPENVRTEDGSDLVIYLGGYDPDEQDPKGFCTGNLASFETVISTIPNLDRLDFSTLYQYIDPFEQVLTEPVSNDGHIPIARRRGPQITQNDTVVADPLRRVILASVFFSVEPDATSSVSHFSYYFRDADAASVDVNLDVEVRHLRGVDPGTYGESWRQIIAYVVGVAASTFVLLFIVVILSLMSRKPQIEENDDGWIEYNPDQDEYYEQVEVEQEWGDVGEKPKSPFEELLLREELLVIMALCEVVESKDGQVPAELDEVAGALVAIFEFHNHSLELIQKLIEREVAEASSAGTLFRSNSLASKVMSAYAKKIGRDYLQNTLTVPISHILDKNFSLEVDPRKLGPGEDRKANLKRLVKASESFFDWIITSGNNAPPQFKIICYHLYKEVNQKFPQNRYSAVGGFIFLRFFCPAIVNPDGLIPERHLSFQNRRCFMLVTKVLQNLSNGQLFGQKESHMNDDELNGFIEKHHPELVSFFESMSVEDTGGRPAAVDLVELEEALIVIHRHLYIKLQDIEEVLNTNKKAHQTDDGSVQSEMATKMTDAFSTFLHTYSLIESSIMETNGQTRTKTKTKTRSKTSHSRTEVSDTEWANDSMGDPSSFSLDTEQIEPVPFTHLNDSSEVTDFDLSSQIPEESIGSEDETESLLSHYPRRRRKSESRSRSTWGGRTDRRRSFMTNMTDMSMMTSFGRASMSNYGDMDPSESLGSSYLEREFEEEEEEEEGEGEGSKEGLSITGQLVKVLEELGVPPGL